LLLSDENKTSFNLTARAEISIRAPKLQSPWCTKHHQPHC